MTDGIDDSAVSADALRFADVAVDSPQFAGGAGVFTYSLSDINASKVQTGTLVWVPLRRQTVLGWVVRTHGEKPEFTVRNIAAVVEPGFKLTPDQVALAEWISASTVSSMYASGALFFPPGISHRSVEQFELTDGFELRRDDLTASEHKVVEFLQRNGPATIADFREEMRRVPRAALQKLEMSGEIHRTVRLTDRLPVARKTRFVRMRLFDRDAVARAPSQLAALEYLALRERLSNEAGTWPMLAVSELAGGAGVGDSTIAALERKGLVEILALEERDVPTMNRLVEPPQLTQQQSIVWQQLQLLMNEKEVRRALLHGVTGSGKTEIYLRAVGLAIAQGQGAIVLVPEIALASQIVRRFEERFPGKVAAWHSEMSEFDRFSTWESVAAGRVPVVVGPRSALFAPVVNLGVIIIDEEHDQAYKQGVEPRYHARSVAEKMSESKTATLILGSATPAVETYYRAERGEYHLLELPDRIGPALAGAESGTASVLPMPSVEIVDLRHELHQGRVALISGVMQQAVELSLSRGEQSILLLNRRGMATSVVCSRCGHALLCLRCETPLVYHQDRARLICHRCNFYTRPPRNCGDCGGALVYLGAGTQRIEAEAHRLFPTARVVRWDRDSIKRLGGYDHLIRQVEQGAYDIVVGTQMVAKGFDMPLMSTIGVIYGDASIRLPDFRASERTYQLLSQVAGRAGRRTSGARVVVQAYDPDHYAIQAAANHEFQQFYRDELPFRQQFGYPPLGRLIQMAGRNKSDGLCEEQGLKLKDELLEHISERGAEVEVLGPAPAFIAKIRDLYQWQLLLRGRNAEILKVLPGLPTLPGWTTDVDPQSLV